MQILWMKKEQKGSKHKCHQNSHFVCWLKWDQVVSRDPPNQLSEADVAGWDPKPELAEAIFTELGT